MCQFSGRGHRVPGKVLAVAQIPFPGLRNHLRANLSYAPWRGCTKPGTFTWRATLEASSMTRLPVRRPHDRFPVMRRKESVHAP